MPTKFSEQEQKIIKQKLINKANQFFTKYGFKKTSVKELTDAVGISKGSFYSFFDSKEELLFEVFEEQEKFRNRIFTEIIDSDLDGEESLMQLFNKTFRQIENNRFFKRIYEENLIERMIRKLPPEKMHKHHAQDLKDAKELIQFLQKHRNLVQEPPEVIVGLFRGLFFVTLYEEEIGQGIFEDVMNLLFSSLAKGLIRREEKNNDKG